MKTLLILIPYLISFLIGHLTIGALCKKDRKLDSSIHFFLAGGLGLGISVSIVFFSFVITNIFNKILVLSIHIILLIALLLHKSLTIRKRTRRAKKESVSNKFKVLAFFGLLALFFVPVWMQAKFFPHGGWDAWSVWNFKAKFLFLSQGQWQNLFDPLLWRTSPHYPLLLPLINVWAWAFINNPDPLAPLITSLLFTFLTVGFLFSTLRSHMKNSVAFLAPLLLITIPFFNKLAISQYCDIVIGYYIFTSIYCLLMMIQLNKSTYALLSGLFLGILTFSKPEGMIASVLLIFLAVVLFLLFEPKKIKLATKQMPLFCLLLGVLLMSLPSLVFKWKYSPGNLTFINGLTSEENPITLYRLKMIFAFLVSELKSQKWNGLWFLLFGGLLLSRRKCLRKETLLIPLFLFSYLSVVLLYYVLNTYFKIEWWLAVTLNRILFSLLPLLLFWVFTSLMYSEDNKKKSS